MFKLANTQQKHLNMKIYVVRDSVCPHYYIKITAFVSTVKTD